MSEGAPSRQLIADIRAMTDSDLSPQALDELKAGLVRMVLRGRRIDLVRHFVRTHGRATAMIERIEAKLPPGERVQ
jgi:hypothetical protein